MVSEPWPSLLPPIAPKACQMCHPTGPASSQHEKIKATEGMAYAPQPNLAYAPSMTRMPHEGRDLMGENGQPRRDLSCSMFEQIKIENGHEHEREHEDDIEVEVVVVVVVVAVGVVVARAGIKSERNPQEVQNQQGKECVKT